MIKIEELRDYLPAARVNDASGFDLNYLQSEISKEAAQNDIPVAFYYDKVKSGNLFNREIEDCLVIHHPEHKKDYYSICIRVKRQGNMAYVTINDFGESKQINKNARAEWAKEDRKGKSLSYKIGSSIGSGLHNIGRSKKKLEDEQFYYDALDGIIKKAIFE